MERDRDSTVVLAGEALPTEDEGRSSLLQGARTF